MISPRFSDSTSQETLWDPTDSFSSDELLRYSRQINLNEIGISGQEKLKHAKVLCVGLGGLGSSVLLYLAAAGIGRLGLMDADNLELSNLQRQVLYRSDQISFSKAACAATQISALNPEIHVDVYEEKLTEKNAVQKIQSYDLIAGCSDNFDTSSLLHEVCFKEKKPFVYASVSNFQGYCSVFHGGEDPCFCCVFPTLPDSQTASNARGILGVVPGMLGVIQATEILKWVLGIGLSLEKRLLIADLLTMSFKEVVLVKNPDCPLCSRLGQGPTYSYQI